MAIPPVNDLKQATGPTRTAALPRYDAALPVAWLRGVGDDKRIAVLHRFALIGIGLHHRRDEPDAVGSAIGLDRACILRALDIGVRRGWLADSKHSGLLFTFPAPPAPLAEPSTLLRRTP